jgi:NAD-dependent dihydropyrimidine dehydrogenase PreA subunit/nitroreductase
MESRFVEVPSISIKNGTCSVCNLCVKTCPVRIFRFGNKEQLDGRISINHPEECVLCGQCLCVCPTGSIDHSGFVKDNFRPLMNTEHITAESAFEFLAGRRSVRNYLKDAPPRELLDKVVQIAGFAPGSPHHRVGWVRNITVVYGQENMKVVLDMTAEYMSQLIRILKSNFLKLAAKFSDAAKAGLAVVPDMEMRVNEYYNGGDSIIYRAPAAMFFHAPVASSTPQTDSDTAALLVQLYAHANGLGTCWNGLIQGAAAGDHVKGFRKLSDFLKIPAGHKCYAAMTIGYPSVKLHSIPERKVQIDRI